MLFERAIWPVDQVLQLAEYQREEVSQIVLVGGTTRMPKVRELVRNYFGKEPNWSVDPDQAVAWGTAVQVLRSEHFLFVLLRASVLG